MELEVRSILDDFELIKNAVNSNIIDRDNKDLKDLDFLITAATLSFDKLIKSLKEVV